MINSFKNPAIMRILRTTERYEAGWREQNLFQTMEALGWEYLKEKLTIDLTDDLRAAIDPAPFGRHALEEDRGCFTSRGYLYPSGDEWQHDRPQEKPADRKPSIKERLEQSKQECMGKNKEPAPHKGKSEPEL